MEILYTFLFGMVHFIFLKNSNFLLLHVIKWAFYSLHMNVNFSCFTSLVAKQPLYTTQVCSSLK